MIFLCSNYLIPSGKYGHSNKEIIDNLKDSKIYRTDKDIVLCLRLIINSKYKHVSHKYYLYGIIIVGCDSYVKP